MRYLAASLCLCFLFFAYHQSFAEESCILNPIQRSFVKEAFVRFFDDAIFTAEFSDPSLVPPHLGVSFSLIGINEGQHFAITLAETCNTAKFFEPTCQRDGGRSELWRGHDFCFRLGCEGRGIYATDVTFLEREKAGTGLRHPFEFTSPRGQFRYSANPDMTWRVDAVSFQEMAITGNRYLHFTAVTGNQKINLTHDANVVISRTRDHITSFALTMTFPYIVAGSTPIVVTLYHDIAQDPYKAYGAISHGGKQLAQLEGTAGSSTTVTWISACR